MRETGGYHQRPHPTSAPRIANGSLIELPQQGLPDLVYPFYPPQKVCTAEVHANGRINCPDN